MKGRIKRRVQIDANLYFEYEVSPHRAILARISELSAKVLTGLIASPQQLGEAAVQVSERAVSASTPTVPTGMHIPFKQARLKGQVNPLKPPLHVETVLIGRALGQQTGYLLGVGFRIRDDGYVEGEFVEGAQKFTSFEKFREEVSCRLADPAPSSSTEGDG
ncbi:hypothetical protein FXV83_35990 [Bradyrhizobium hipponense]|uniref:Uncharacterized protein n=1 Tax=Bradyrhizobium hipponense TaxID=2605638 RepID=A0A5S4YEF8_9BRAD|nr:hypothetical protein [Bradyrhizobium hipponense]TYO61857.1 hypothetical protein FXV83_35990 [Bradyrhizobium hipponense]